MDTPHNLYQLLAKIAFLTADCQALPIAEKIFQSIHKAKPEHQTPIVGLAYTALLASKFDEAVTLLRDKVLAANPDNPTAKAYLGLALGCKGDLEASNAILAQVLQDAKGTSAAKFAELVPQFLKGIKGIAA